jgi:hypothetical protein
MKFRISTIAIILLLVFSISGCDDYNLNKGLDNKSIDNNRTLIDRVKERYNIDYIKTLSDKKYKVIYENGGNLIVEKTGNSEMYITGTKIDQSEKYFSFKTSESGFVTDVFELNAKSAAPCSEHDEGETYDECYDGEMDALCSDPLSCIAINTPPQNIIIIAMVSIHCSACVDDDDDEIEP